MYLKKQKRLAKLSKKKDGKKRVYIVEGGPGTGKSVIAINLFRTIFGKVWNELSVYNKKSNTKRCLFCSIKRNI